MCKIRVDIKKIPQELELKYDQIKSIFSSEWRLPDINKKNAMHFNFPGGIVKKMILLVTKTHIMY